MNKREKLLRDLDLHVLTGIEIGPLTSPIVSRTDGEIIYVDHADTDTLRLKYASHSGIDVSCIVEIDAVWGSKTLQEAIGSDRKVDYVLASHVVEHVPDLLGWLGEIESVLHPDGTLRLAIPDRRFTFDYLRQETRLSDILNARLVRARAPLPTQILDHVLEVVAFNPEAAWRGENEAITKLNRLHSPQDAIFMAEDALRNGTYHDVHCWVFTPASFAHLLRRTAELGLHHFSCIDYYDTEPGQVEFQVILSPCAEEASAVRSWDRMARAAWVNPPDATCTTSTLASDNSEELRRRLAYADTKVATLLVRTELAENRVAAIETSTCWRITGPIRALTNRFRPSRNTGTKPKPAKPEPIGLV